MSTRVSVFLLLLVTCALLLLVVSAGAQDLSGEPPQADPAALPNGSPTVSIDRLAPSALANIPGWTQIAYQRQENDNWDIYLYDAGGAERLTTNAADDIYPALNRGGTKVAFSSSRGNGNGRLDLYTMNSDKSGLNKIFDNWSAFPAFSPDGSKIAFQGWAGNDYEIYVINTDGSNLKRLTNHSDFDGQPTWSPNGDYIAFSSRRNSQYSIYTITPNGTDLQKVSTYPLSLHPKWAPNSNRIAFDADVDGDGWQEVALVNSDGSGEQMIYDPGNSATAWAGSWSPDGQSLGITDITLERQNNQWVWVKGELKQWDVDSQNISELIPGDTNWYFDWVSLDLIPPVVHLNPVNKYSDADTFWLSWSGTDFGGSGLKDYSVHYQSPSSNGWRTYWNDTVATAAQFVGEPGETFDFLVRARDNALNVGVWSEQPVVSTTFYKTKISGRLLDNRGTPLSDIPINLNPLPINPAETDQQGEFSALAITTGVTTLTVDQPNYMKLPVTDISPNGDFNQNLTLIPTDNQVTNGTFEADATSPTGWTTGGTLPVFITAQSQSSGLYSVQFGSNSLISTQEAQAIDIGTLSQDLTIPGGKQAITLAFMARATGDVAGDGSGLEVLIQPEGGAADTLFQGRLGPGWSIHYYTLKNYENRKVELLFRVVKDSADPPLSVFVDDISIGSAYPELWVDMQAHPQSAINGDIVTLNLDYGNRGGISAVDSQLVLTLNPDMVYQSSNPPGVKNGNQVSWDLATLPGRSGKQTLEVKTLVTGTPPQPRPVSVVISSDTDEANLNNNQDQDFIRVKREIYFPAIIQGP